MHIVHIEIMHADARLPQYPIFKMFTFIIIIVIKIKIIKYGAVSGSLVYNFDLPSSCIIAITSLHVNVAPRFFCPPLTFYWSCVDCLNHTDELGKNRDRRLDAL